MNEDEIAVQEAYQKQWESELIDFEDSGMVYVAIFYMQWMYVFQLFYQGMFAGRNKRVMKYYSVENVIDTVLLLCGTSYLVIILRDYRYDTFLKAPTEAQEAKTYFDNYIDSPVMENYLLFLVCILLWIKAVI